MLIRFHIVKDKPVAPYRTGHKPLALVYSLALHVGVVALLFLPASLGSESNPYHSVVVQLEKDHKLIYYDFRKELPEVSASNQTAQTTTPSPDALKSKQRIVAQPKENPGKQLVYLPEPRAKLQADLSAPNLIAIETPVDLPMPDRPQPKPFQAPEAPRVAPSQVAPLPNAPALASNANTKDPALSALLNKPNGPIKAFVAPAARAATPAAPAALPNAPAVTSGTSDNSAIASLLNKSAGPPLKKFSAPAAAATPTGSVPAPLPNAPAIADSENERTSAVAALLNKPSGPVRQFTPPSQVRRAAGATYAPAALPSAPAVNSSSGDQSSAVAALLNKPGGPPPRPFSAPAGVKGSSGGSASEPAALPAPPSVATTGQPASATVAILGLNPANVPQIPRPEGSRSARIEAGIPIPGATRAELGGGNSSISVPDVSIQGIAPTSPATATRLPLERATPPPTGLARPQAPKILATTPHVSTPQWPNNRHLPAAVDRHFQNRVVYISLIPAEQSGDDWIVWYAETAAGPIDPSLVIHPPTLMKAGALPPFPAHTDHGTGSIRLTGVIGKDGHFGALSDLSGVPADKELAEALQAWQFGPARRNGVTFDADTVIEIPVMFGRLSLR
jgi:hypothetical protein